MKHQILAVDRALTPDRWIDVKTALNLYVRGHIGQFVGDDRIVLRGGRNARTGLPSTLEFGSIAIIAAKKCLVRDHDWAPSPTRELLFLRDRHLCAYCGFRFKDRDLDAEHVQPESRGGAWSWTNLVAACRRCNARKGNSTPEEAGMKLLYLPYRPSRFESLILANRRILAGQMDFLIQRVPRSSRLFSSS
jgi:hypothetical protein